MQEFVVKYIADIGVTDIIDILIVTFAVYKVIGFIQESRAGQLVKGLLLLVIATFASDALNFYTTNWILKTTTALGVIALVIVFQPELRRGLEHMGRSKLSGRFFANVSKEEAKKIVSELQIAVDEMASKKVGALIVIEREVSLKDICETGTYIDSQIVSPLVENIFYMGSPLHDGAAIIRGGRLAYAGCVLPLTENKELPHELGTRHRAGIGITEKSDAIAFIISEETGIISLAREGNLERYLDMKRVEKTLLDLYLKDDGKKKGHKRKAGKDDE